VIDAEAGRKIALKSAMRNREREGENLRRGFAFAELRARKMCLGIASALSFVFSGIRGS
jgi:hypothetical protein